MNTNNGERGQGRVSARTILSSIKSPNRPSSPRVLPLTPTTADKDAKDQTDTQSLGDEEKPESSAAGATLVQQPLSAAGATLVQQPLSAAGATTEQQPQKTPSSPDSALESPLIKEVSKKEDKDSSRLSVSHQLLGVSNSSLSHTGTDDDVKLITINDAIGKAGLGKYHILPGIVMVLVILLKVFFDGAPDHFMGVFSCIFQLTHSTEHLLPSLGFAGSIFGAVTGGILADRFGRRYVTGAVLCCLIVVLTCITGAVNYPMMVVFYFLFAALVSAIYPIILVYILELSPTRTRYITLFCGFTCYSLLSFILPLCFMGLFNSGPDIATVYHSDRWRIAWGMLIPITILTIPVLYFSPNSPRFHTAKGNSDEAHKIVIKMVSTNLPNSLALESMEISPNSDPVIPGLSLVKLFYRPIQGTTILLTAFLFVCNFQYFASHVLTEEMLTNRCSCGVDMTSKTPPWNVNYYCDEMSGIECNPSDLTNRTCCYETNNTCIINTGVLECIQYTCSNANPLPEKPHIIDEGKNETDVDHRCTKGTESKYYVFNALRNFLYLPGFAIGIFLAQYTTRKDAFIHLAFHITFINGLLFAVCKLVGGRALLLFVSSLGFNTVIGAVYSLSWLYMIEYYPTSLRCTGVGFLSGVGSLGHALGSLLSKALLMYDLGVFERLTIHLFLSNLLTVLSFMLELETKRLPMSDRKRIDCLDLKIEVEKPP